MKYEISKATAPAMPNLGKGTECVKLLLSQASKVMHEPLVPMFFPALGAHMSGAEFQYPDRSWKEPTGMMANLVAKSGDNKGQLSCLVEAICRDFRQHDEEELKKLVEWGKQTKTRGANKEKPARPDTAILFPFHEDSHPSLSFKVSKNTYRCFVCGASGGTIVLANVFSCNCRRCCPRWSITSCRLAAKTMASIIH